MDNQNNQEQELPDIKVNSHVESDVQGKKHVEGDIRKKIKTINLTEVKEFLIKQKLIIGVVAVFLVIISVCVFAFRERPEEDFLEEVIAEVEEADEMEETVVEPDVLEQDAYPEINELMNKYYTAMADGDMDTVNHINAYIDETEQIKILKKSDYIETYPMLTVYTKKGPEEDSYIAYVRYEVKFIDFEMTAPGLNTWYVCKDESGEYKIVDGELEDSVVEFLKTVSSGNDVIDLFNGVQVEYNEIKETNIELSDFLDDLSNLLATAVGEALVELEEPEEEPEVVEETTEQSVKVLTVRAIEVVNVRSSDSQESDKVGKAQVGDEFDLVEHQLNGWSHIIFDGEDAYIMSEYLEDGEVEQIDNTDVESETADTESTENTTESEDTTNQDEIDVADSSDVTGTIRVEDTINIRSTASTSGDKLGVVYPGDELQIVMKQADGWTKVLYKDRTGYVKTSLLE